jgi:chaperonin cofactor prefoldin
MKRAIIVWAVVALAVCSFWGLCFAQQEIGTTPQLQQPKIAVNLDKAEEQVVKKDANTISINKIAYDKTGNSFVIASQPVGRFQLNRVMQQIDAQLTILTDKDKLAQAISDLQAQKKKIQDMLDLIKPVVDD